VRWRGPYDVAALAVDLGWDEDRVRATAQRLAAKGYARIDADGVWFDAHAGSLALVKVPKA
jgi:hypothetical protein